MVLYKTQEIKPTLTSGESNLQTAANNFDQTIPDWNHIEQASVVSPTTVNGEGVALVDTSAGALSVSFHEDYVRLKSVEGAEDNYQILKNVQPTIAAALVMQESNCVLTAGEWRMVIEHSPFSFVLEYKGKLVSCSPMDGHFVRQRRIPPLAKTAKGWLLSFDLNEHEPVYGLGEKWGRLDKRGQFIHSYNHDALGVNAEISYKNTPFAWSPSGWGVFTHTPAPVSHAVGFAQWSHRTYSVYLEDQNNFLFFPVVNFIDLKNQLDILLGQINNLLLTYSSESKISNNFAFALKGSFNEAIQHHNGPELTRN